ncbi:MAG: hypothetical protein RIM99_06425 [Cyclobacteriaceae bacterium]
MKSKNIPLAQFAFETKYLEGDNEELLESISSHVGHLVYEFNLLEERLTSFLCELISHSNDAKGLIITKGLGYSSKVDLFNRFIQHIQHVYQRQIEPHDVLIANLKDCAAKRNAVVHAEWSTIDLEGYAFVKLRISKRGIVQEFAQLDENSLITIRNTIIETYNSFDDYEDEYAKVIHCQ